MRERTDEIDNDPWNDAPPFFRFHDLNGSEDYVLKK